VEGEEAEGAGDDRVNGINGVEDWKLGLVGIVGRSKENGVDSEGDMGDFIAEVDWGCKVLAGKGKEDDSMDPGTVRVGVGADNSASGASRTGVLQPICSTKAFSTGADAHGTSTEGVLPLSGSTRTASTGGTTGPSILGSSSPVASTTEGANVDGVSIEIGIGNVWAGLVSRSADCIAAMSEHAAHDASNRKVSMLVRSTGAGLAEEDFAIIGVSLPIGVVKISSTDGASTEGVSLLVVSMLVTSVEGGTQGVSAPEVSLLAAFTGGVGIGGRARTYSSVLVPSVVFSRNSRS